MPNLDDAQELGGGGDAMQRDDDGDEDDVNPGLTIMPPTSDAGQSSRITASRPLATAVRSLSKTTTRTNQADESGSSVALPPVTRQVRTAVDELFNLDPPLANDAAGQEPPRQGLSPYSGVLCNRLGSSSIFFFL